MKHFYFGSIRKINVQFLNLFNNVNIARFNEDGEIDKYIPVPIKLFPKMKMWYWINQRNEEKLDKELPIMGCELISILPAENRIGGKYEKIKKEDKDGESTLFFNKVPYDFSYRLSIWTEYLLDLDQILEQILPFFNPHIHIKVSYPDMGLVDDKALELKTVLEGVNSDIANELPIQDWRSLVYTIDFRVEGFTFLPLMKKSHIKEINIPVHAGNTDNYTTDHQHIITALDYDDYESTEVVPSGAHIDEDAKMMWTYEVLDLNNE